MNTAPETTPASAPAPLIESVEITRAKKTIITSFSPKGWDEYGRDFLATFVQHWPLSVGHVELVIYHEPGQPDVNLHRERGVTWLPIEMATNLSGYLSAVEHFPLLRGEHATEHGRAYNIQTDARQARKVFMEVHAAETYGGKVYWLDADTITHADVPEEFLDDVLPDDKLCCYLGRHTHPNPQLRAYTESGGLLGFNTAHPQCLPFLRMYRKLFETGTFLTFGAYHDCVAFDVLREAFERQLPGAFVNLGAGVDYGPGLHVAANSVVAKYWDHKKGGRKSMPRTPDADLMTKREEPYWKS